MALHLAGAPSAHAASVIATVPVGSQPHGVAVNRRTNLIYVANTGGGSGNTVSVIEGLTNTVSTTLVVGLEPFGVAVNPLTSRIYVSNHVSDSVSVIDGDPLSPNFHTVIATIPVGNEPEEFAINPLTNRIYVSNWNAGAASTVSVIDGASNTVLTNIVVGDGPDGVAVDPGTNRIWVANFYSGTISVISGATQTVVNTIPGLTTANDLDYDPLTNRLYVTLYTANQIAAIDATSSATLATVPVGGSPDGVALGVFGNRAYVANAASDNLSVIDTVLHRVLETIGLQNAPREATFNPLTRRLYVSNSGSNSVSVLEDPSECCDMSTTTPGGLLTVTGAGRFEMRFNPVTGGGIDQFFDLASDPGRSRDLAGGEPAWNSYPALFIDRIWYDVYPGASAFGQSAGDGFGQDSSVHLLEATPTRVKVRQETVYHHSLVQGTGFRIPALKGLGDYSIYGVGRLALKWQRRAFGPITWGGGPASLGAAELDWVVHRDTAVPALNAWNVYRPTTGLLPPNTNGGLGSGSDDFLVMKGDSASVRSDFLATLFSDWPDAQVTAHKDFSGSDKAAFLAWDDNRTGAAGPHIRNWVAGNADTFNFLTSFRPTNLADHLDAAVTTRASDYRIPAPISLFQGTRWADAAENTAGASDFYNESEAAYVFDFEADGVEFDISGSLAAPVYKPFFKIRQWQSLQPPTYVGLEGRRLSAGVDYFADVKPVSRSYFVEALSWHCTFESTSACTPGTGLDVGGAGSAALVGAILPGRYGNAADFTSDLDSATAGTAGSADFSAVIGAVEFWYQPHYDHDDGARHLIWFNQSGAAANFHCFFLEKNGFDELRFSVLVNYGDAGCTVPDGNSINQFLAAPAAGFGWRTNDWVHIKATWNAGGGLKKLRLFADGRELAFSGSYTAPPSHGPTVFGGCSSFLLCPGGMNGNANGQIDEPHIYTGLDGASGEALRSIAHAGLLADPSEYLADAGRNFEVGLQPVDGAFRGKYLYIGSDARFHGLNVDLLTLGTGANPGGLQWEYWDGTKWANLEAVAGFTDTTQSLMQSGRLHWTLTPPNWSPFSVDGGPDLYYARVYLIGAPYASFPTERRIKTDILLFQYCGDVAAGAQTFDFPLSGTADLSIAKTDSQISAVPGASITYTITVTNNGPDTVTSLTVNDPVPGAISSPSFTPSTGVYDGITGLWTGLNLTSTQSVQLTFAGTIDPFARGGLLNTATV